jgi:hypothetical protein
MRADDSLPRGWHRFFLEAENQKLPSAPIRLLAPSKFASMPSTKYSPRTEAEREVSRSHPFKWAPHCLSPNRLERFVLFLSYIHFLATLTATLLCLELVFSDSALAHATGFLSRALLPIGLLGVVNVPFLFWIRSSGIRRFHFLEHEAQLDATHLLPARSCSHNTGPDTYDEMNGLIQAIDGADVWDRPAARKTAKEWIIANRACLDQAAWAHLRQHVGYLLSEEVMSYDVLMS